MKTLVLALGITALGLVPATPAAANSVAPPAAAHHHGYVVYWRACPNSSWVEYPHRFHREAVAQQTAFNLQSKGYQAFIRPVW